MKLVCRQLRRSDTWFQTGFVVVFLGAINAAFFLWPDANFHENLFAILLIDAVILLFVFSNTLVWITTENDVRVTQTVLGFVPWRSRSIPHVNLLHVVAKRISDNEAWSNCTTELYWTENGARGMLVTKSTFILQRRQELALSVAEAKQVAKTLGVRFVDNTNEKASSTRQRTDSMEPDF